MKRLFALLLVISMLLSLTLPASAEEVVEEIVEEVAEEVIEEAVEEESAEEVIEEVTEEAEEEVVEEVTEEAAEEITFSFTSTKVASAVAEVNDEPNLNEKCPYCADVYIKDCREHWGPYTLWMHMPDRGISFLRGIELFCGESITTKLVVGNLFDQQIINSVTVMTMGTDQQPYQNPGALTIIMTESTGEDKRPDFTITVNQPGTHLIRYYEQVEDGVVIPHDVTILGLGENDTVFYATRSDGTGYYSQLNYNGIWQLTGLENGYKLYLKKSASSNIPVDPAKLFTTADDVSIRYNTEDRTDYTAHVTVSSMIDACIGYRHLDGNTYWLPAGYDGLTDRSDMQAELFCTDENGGDVKYSLTMQEGDKVTRWFRYGSTGASVPVTQFDSMNGDGINIQSVNEGLELEACRLGAHATLSFGGDSFSVTVPDPNAGVESGVPKLFLATTESDPSGNKIFTYFEPRLNPDDTEPQEFNLKFYFGTSVANAIEPKGLKVIAGDSIELTERENDYKLAAKKAGYSVIAYEDPITKLQYCMPVNIVIGSNNSNKMARNYVEFDGITAGIGLTGWAGMETLDYFSQIGDYYRAGSSNRFGCTLGLLVRENGEYVNSDRLTDVSFELLGCDVQGAVTLGQMKDYTENGIFTTKTVEVQGEPNTTYRATVAVSYTLDGSKRFTHQIQLWRNMTLSDVEIYATEENLGTAGQLNVVLSSWEALNAWVKDTQGYEVTPGAAVTLYLPPVSYNEVIVAQAMSPVNYDNPQPLSLIKLCGSKTESGNSRTKMCGLIEKASLVGIGDIDFAAIKGKTMTATGEKKAFTCGIMTDYKTDFRPVYDEDYLSKYCNGVTPSLELPAERIQQYGDIFNTAIDLSQIYDCSFVGFDYGVRSTPYGHIGSNNNNVYADNYYGIYIDNDGSDSEKYPGGDDSADAGNATQTDYTRLTFENNEYAVRIVSIPCDATDYRVRVHDSNFIDNFREFWIDEDGLFYFYRNYFAGKWHENENHHGDWEEYKDVLPAFDEQDEQIDHYYVISDHRPGRVHYDKGDPSTADTLVIVNPCRRTESFDETVYWFYSGEDQFTVIEQGDDSMPISGEAVAELKDEAEITVVNNGEPVITYTFKGNQGGNMA